MIKLDGSETDVLYRLGKYGACEDGDLPSKQGMAGLINKGLAIKDYNLPFANALTENGIGNYLSLLIDKNVTLTRNQVVKWIEYNNIKLSKSIGCMLNDWHLQKNDSIYSNELVNKTGEKVCNVIVNISRPYPDNYWENVPEIYQNKHIIEYIEPLLQKGLVRVSDAYHFNKKQFDKGEQCSVSGGFKYYFWFNCPLEAFKFKEHFDGDFVLELSNGNVICSRLVEMLISISRKEKMDIFSQLITENSMPMDISTLKSNGLIDIQNKLPVITELGEIELTNLIGETWM